MIRLRYLIPAALCFLGALGIAKWAFAGPNRWGQLWYTSTTNAQADSAAARYKYIVAGIQDVLGPNITRIKHTNSAVRVLAYITPDQNPELTGDLMGILAQETTDIEGCFLHYNDATSMFVLQQPTWPAYDTPAGGRVTTRRAYPPGVFSYVPNYASAAKRTVWRRAMVRYITETPYVRGAEPPPVVYANGIFLDNSAINMDLVPDLCKGTFCLSGPCVGHPCNGGHVTESGGLDIKTNAFQSWWRTQSINLFTGTLGDTLRSLGKVFVHNAQPQPGAFSPYNSISALPMVGSTSWGGPYFWEFTQGVIYNSWGTAADPVADTSYVRYVRARELAVQADSSWSWFSTHLMTCGWSIAETIRSNLSMWLVVRNDSTVFQHQGANTAAVDSVIWSPMQRTVQKLLGNPTGGPLIRAQGTDPTGKAYAVWGRPYQNGYALVRPRHFLAQTCEATTAVNVVLASNPDYYLIHPDGTYGPGLAGTFAVRNGHGIVVLNKSKVPPPEEIEP